MKGRDWTRRWVSDTAKEATRHGRRKITLITGGHRAGKSDVAEQLVGDGPTTYIATLVARDENMRARVARHQRMRPARWSLVEEPIAVPSALRRVSGTVLFDSLSQWVTNDVRGVSLCEDPYVDPEDRFDRRTRVTHLVLIF